MRSRHRTALNIALTVATLMGLNCVAIAAPKKVARQDPRMNPAQQEERRGNLQEAKRLYTTIHQDDPGNAECSHRLGRVYAKLNRHSEAEVFYSKSYSVNPRNPQLLLDRGYTAFLRKDFEQSQRWLQEAIDCNPGDVDSAINRRAINNLAIIRAWMHEDDASLATFRKIHSEEESLRNLAAIQIARGDKTLGLKNYDLAQSLIRTGALSRQEELPPAPQIFSNVPRELSNPEAPQLLIPPSPIESGNVSATRQPEESRSEAVDPFEVPSETDSAPVVSVSESKVDWVRPGVRKVIALAVFPPPVTAIGASFSSPPVSSAGSVDTGLDGVPPLPEDKTTREIDEELIFELPVLSSPQSRLSEKGGILLIAYERAVAKPAEVEQPSERPWDEADEPQRPSKSDETSVTHRSMERPDFAEICLVTLRDDRSLRNGVPRLNYEYQGQQYTFSSGEALKKFQANPDRYIPSAGGLDVVVFRGRREVIQGSIKYAAWYHDHLYVFSSQESKHAFQQNPRTYSTMH